MSTTQGMKDAMLVPQKVPRLVRMTEFLVAFVLKHKPIPKRLIEPDEHKRMTREEREQFVKGSWIR
jgi:hypothetical protein